MDLQLSSNTHTIIINNISSSDTIITVESVESFPILTNQEYFYLDIILPTGEYETVKVTNINSATKELIVSRGEGSTSPLSFSAGTHCGLRIGKAVITDLITAIDTKLPQSGGELSGYLTLHSNPIQDFHAVTKQYVDIRIETYTHNQILPSSVWEISHNLGKFPAVTVVDSAGTVVIGEITYNNSSSITIDFTGAIFSGKAYLN